MTLSKEIIKNKDAVVAIATASAGNIIKLGSEQYYVIDTIRTRSGSGITMDVPPLSEIEKLGDGAVKFYNTLSDRPDSYLNKKTWYFAPDVICALLGFAKNHQLHGDITVVDKQGKAFEIHLAYRVTEAATLNVFKAYADTIVNSGRWDEQKNNWHWNVVDIHANGIVYDGIAKALKIEPDSEADIINNVTDLNDVKKNIIFTLTDYWHGTDKESVKNFKSFFNDNHEMLKYLEQPEVVKKLNTKPGKNTGIDPADEQPDEWDPEYPNDNYDTDDKAEARYNWYVKTGRKDFAAMYRSLSTKAKKLVKQYIKERGDLNTDMIAEFSYVLENIKDELKELQKTDKALCDEVTKFFKECSERFDGYFEYLQGTRGDLAGIEFAIPKSWY